MKAPALQRSVTVVREGGKEGGRLRDVGEGGRKGRREGWREGSEGEREIKRCGGRGKEIERYEGRGKERRERGR